MTVLQTELECPDFLNDSSTLVHAQETSDSFPRLASYRGFLLSGVGSQYTHVDNVYTILSETRGPAALSALRSCRNFAFFSMHKETREVRVFSSRCNVRWCPLCIRTRRFFIEQSVTKWLKEQERPRFLTFTLKHSSDALEVQIRRLYSCFRKLRRSKWWTDHTDGGIWFFQITKSKSDGRWHPHIHCLSVGRYMPHAQLSDHWLRVTGDSSIVDIRAVKSAGKAAKYVARYAAAPCRLSDFDLDASLEIVKAMHNQRIVGKFGCAKSINFNQIADYNKDDWQNCGSFFKIASTCYLDDLSKAIFEAWKTGEPLPDSIDLPPPEMPLTEIDIDRYSTTYEQLRFEFKGVTR